MRYSVVVVRAAKKQLAALDRVVRRRIEAAIDALADEPLPQGAIRLQGPNGDMRIRVGDYRIIYSVDGEELLVLVVRVGHRREVYER